MIGKLSPEYLKANLDDLASNPYPGRGIVLGLNSRGDTAVQAYWIMGRSEELRNRMLQVVGDGKEERVQASAVDYSKVILPSLVNYNAMRIAGNKRDYHVVSNGNQTDKIVDHFNAGDHLDKAVDTFEFEDSHSTTHLTGSFGFYDRLSLIAALTVTRGELSTGKMATAIFRSKTDELKATAGTGQCVHEYKNDGYPLPSFSGSPITLPLGETLEETAEMYWDNLSPYNRVAIAVKGINLSTRETSYSIINASEQQ